MAETCTHLDQVTIRDLPEASAGCEECLAAGGKWVHLRICLACGHVGCCDSSPGRHATAHAGTSGHQVIRSLQPGERWCWCYTDRLMFVLPEVQGETRIPPSPLLSGA